MRDTQGDEIPDDTHKHACTRCASTGGISDLDVVHFDLHGSIEVNLIMTAIPSRKYT